MITEAGVHPKVAGLVYVAAFAPDEGETLESLSKPYGATPIFSELRPVADAFLLLTPKGVREDFAQDLKSEEQSTMIATQAATQAAVPSTPITRAAWHTKSSSFVIASNDRAIAPEQERETAKRMKARTLTLLSNPREVAEFFATAAAGAAMSARKLREMGLRVRSP